MSGAEIGVTICCW